MDFQRHLTFDYQSYEEECIIARLLLQKIINNFWNVERQQWELDERTVILNFTPQEQKVWNSLKHQKEIYAEYDIIDKPKLLGVQEKLDE